MASPTTHPNARNWGVVDGIDTPAVFRASTEQFFFRYTYTQGIAYWLT